MCLRTATATRSLLIIAVILFALLFSACSTINTIPPEVNLMKIDVQDVTLSHVNLLAELRIFNPNEAPVTVHGVDYTLHLEGIKVFAGRNNMRQDIEPQDYGFISLRLSSAYWDLIQLLDKLPNKTDVAFSMQGAMRVSGSGMFAKRFSFDKQGVIPLQKLTGNSLQPPN